MNYNTEKLSRNLEHFIIRASSGSLDTMNTNRRVLSLFIFLIVYTHSSDTVSQRLQTEQMNACKIFAHGICCILLRVLTYSSYFTLLSSQLCSCRIQKHGYREANCFTFLNSWNKSNKTWPASIQYKPVHSIVFHSAYVCACERSLKPTGLFSAFTLKEKLSSSFYPLASILVSVHGNICLAEQTFVRISVCARVFFWDRKSTNVFFRKKVNE